MVISLSSQQLLCYLAEYYMQSFIGSDILTRNMRSIPEHGVLRAA